MKEYKISWRNWPESDDVTRVEVYTFAHDAAEALKAFQIFFAGGWADPDVKHIDANTIRAINMSTKEQIKIKATTRIVDSVGDQNKRGRMFVK